MSQEKPYNPLDYENLTINLVRELMTREPVGLPIKESFPGPGVYALFYNGDFAPYAPLSSPDSSVPIYVGKAVPTGARKGITREDIDAPVLFRRLREHAESISAASNLIVAHFRCRHLTVIPLWITMAERFLLEHYQPLWNVCIEGFGLHDPGKGRHAGEIPWWDVLHPGRHWAARLSQTKTKKQALQRLTEYFRQRDA